jgi:hypothetical protein
MPAGNTYEAIATQTLGSAAATVTFSSIPGTYTDLVLVINGGTTDGNEGAQFRLNSDSGTNYSVTYLAGDGSAASSGRGSSLTAGRLNQASSLGATNSLTSNIIVQFMNYSNTTTNKTVISRTNVTTGTYPAVEAMVNLYRSTSAITAIELRMSGSGTYMAGSTFSLYGIKAA